MERIAIVTGGSSGLGLELIKKLIDKNYTIINLSRKTPKLNSEKLFHIKTNFNCNKSIQRAIDQVMQTFEKVNYIFLNAGMWKFEMIEEIDFKLVDEIMKVNFSSNIKLISGLNKLIRISNSKIVISGSINSDEAEVNQITYNVTKTALLGLSESLKVEFEEDNIEVKYFKLDDFNSNLVPGEKVASIKSAEEIVDEIILNLKI